MKLTSTIAAVVLSTGLGLGLVAPAEAAPAADRGHRTSHATKLKKADQAARRLEQARKQAVREITAKDVRLTRALRPHALGSVPVDVADALLANRDADRAALAEWKLAAGAATTLAELAELRSAAKAVRPEVYAAALGAVRDAAELQLTVDEAAAGIDPLALELLDLVDAAYAAIAEVAPAALGVSALAGHTALAPVHAALEAAQAAVDALVVPVEPV